MRRILIPILALTAGAAVGVAIMWVQAIEPPEPAPATVASSEQVALNVQHDGKALRLNWDRNAADVREATHAILHISDGKYQSQMNLDPQSLKTGTATYWPESRSVAFRLELFSPGRTTSGSIDAPGAIAEAAKPSPFATPPPTPKRRNKIVALTSPEVVPEPVAAPSKPSKISRVFGKIPLLRRLKKDPQHAEEAGYRR
jgi:hypothetical protein